MDVSFMGSSARDEAFHMTADFSNQKISLWSTQNVSCIFDPQKIILSTKGAFKHCACGNLIPHSPYLKLISFMYV